jgi:hypothetical protein
MRLLLTFCTILLILSPACNFKKEKIKGTWMAYKVESLGLSSLTSQIESLEIHKSISVYAKMDSFLKEESYRLLSFQSNDILLDDGEVFGQKVGSWQLSNDGKQIILKSVRGNEIFDILKMHSNALLLKKEYLTEDNKKDSIIYTFLQYDGKNVTSFIQNFTYLMNKPENREADALLKERVRKILQFYAEYFDIMVVNKHINSFKPNRIYMPVSFYSNGIGLSPFDANHNWVYLFFDVKDAAKAYLYLEIAFKKAGVYPSGLNTYSAQYAAFFREAANNL